MPSLGQLIDELADSREVIRAIEKRLTELKQEEEIIKNELLTAMDSQDTISATGNRATVRIASSVVPTVHDWNQFYQYIHDHDAFYLLERRPAAAPYREALQSGDTIPGVTPFTRRTLSVRSN